MQHLHSMLSGDLSDVAAALPRMGRVMVIGQANGVTHERIGVIDDVALDDDWIHLRGSAHDAKVARATIANLRVDRTAGMRDKILPRLDFLDAGGAVVFAVVALDGLAPFDTALAEFDQIASVPREKPAVDPAAAEKPPSTLTEDDPAYQPFNYAGLHDHALRLIFEGQGFVQSWSGPLPPPKPAMGFLNIMTADFHLHLKGDMVKEWQVQDRVWRAVNHAGKDMGLRVEMQDALALQGDAE